VRGKKEEAVSGLRGSVENLVIGGGPAGSMLAARLAAAGREVVLLEKQQAAHDKVCGEFISREAVGYLQQLGIEPRELGTISIGRVRLHAGKSTTEAKLPFMAMSLSRRVMDEAMLTKAAAAGCELRRGVFVERVHGADGGWLVRIRGGDSITAKAVFLATGKHDLNGCERGSGVQCDLVGFKMHWRLAGGQTEALHEVMELFLFYGGYGGLSLVEDETANLCFVVTQCRLREMGDWTNLLKAIIDEVPGIRARLQDAIPCWTKALAISPIPYGHLGGTADGIWRIGDQAAVIPSFTGDGISIAMHSAALAAGMYLEGRRADEHLLRLKQQLQTRMRFASNLSRMMVTPGGRVVAPVAMSIFPGAMRWIAVSTRIPERALHECFQAFEARQLPAQLA
jgi:flavin-dependent dehydrogenase